MKRNLTFLFCALTSITFLAIGPAIAGEGEKRALGVYGVAGQRGAALYGGMGGAPAQASDPRQADRQTVIKLGAVQPIFDFDETDLEGVIGYLREVGGVNVVVDWPGLEMEGVDRTTLVSLDLTNVSTAEAMKHILRSLHASSGSCGFMIHNGVVVISTKAGLLRRTDTRIYDVADLARDGDRERMQDNVEHLAGILRNGVFVDTWAGNGGAIGSMEQFDGMLVVTHSPLAHNEIEAILERLRRAKAQRPPSHQQQARQIDLMERMREAAFEPTTMGLIAVGGLRDDCLRPPREIINDLERHLDHAEALGIRNAIRLTLRELYRETGEKDKTLRHLRQMLVENDKAAARQNADVESEPDEDEHEDDDEE